MRSSYSDCDNSPFLNLALQLRTSAVWGNEPIVVVGKSGNFKASIWSCLRTENGLCRCESSATILATLFLTSLLWIIVAFFRLSFASVFSSKMAWSFSVISPDTKLRSTTTSSIFCLAKANHCLISVLKVASFVSKSKSQGEWIKEQEGAIKRRSAPRTSTAFWIKAIDFLKSFFQMFLPSITPRESELFLDNKLDSKISSNCKGQRTRSRWKVCTGRDKAVAKFSPKQSK